MSLILALAVYAIVLGIVIFLAGRGFRLAVAAWRTRRVHF